MSTIKIFIHGIFLTLITSVFSFAQENDRMVRIAKITVDPTQLEAYHQALKMQMTEAIAKEPGVLAYYAVADKKHPTNITILEIYADVNAYENHIKTKHFLTYKETVKDMVTSLQLVDVDMIGYAHKLR